LAENAILRYPGQDVWEGLHLPAYFSIETTTQCPANCIMCPRSKVLQTRKNKLMPDWMIDKILDEIDWECFINWEWINDPLCDDRIYGFMKRANSKGIANWITTTGYLLNEERAYRLLESNTDIIVFSIDTLNRDLYKYIRGLPLSVVLENVERFMDIKHKTGSTAEVWISKIQLPITASEGWEEFKKFFNELGIRKVQFPAYRLRGGDLDKEATPCVPDSRSCYFIENEMSITTDGNIILCPCEAGAWVDPVSNISDRPLREAWFTQKRIDLINLVRTQGLRANEFCREVEGLPE